MNIAFYIVITTLWSEKWREHKIIGPKTECTFPHDSSKFFSGGFIFILRAVNAYKGIPTSSRKYDLWQPNLFRTIIACIYHRNNIPFIRTGTTNVKTGFLDIVQGKQIMLIDFSFHPLEGFSGVHVCIIHDLIWPRISRQNRGQLRSKKERHCSRSAR